MSDNSLVMKNMVKNIFIVRHGHADFGSGVDFQRELTSKGIKRANKTAEYIQHKCQSQNRVLDLCISSAAIRTQQTADIICHTNNLSNCQYYRELYSTMASTWLDKIAHTEATNIVLVGHNPTFSQLLSRLCGNEIYMKPAHCALVTLEFRDDGIIYPATLNDYFPNE
ncbi:MAG: histidine phosphatase family protein [Proteobacteria bacterium]|nr:histidine phosphatase family protein [Pseudomonadota bacterium]